MNFVGIIAEYDPFHSGHALQLRMLRQRGASTIAVCMSTGVVQRGGVPILPEAVRVRAALAAGADLVVALPAPYANASAEQFAAAGVHLLAALGCDTLAFGAETPEPAPLQAAAAALCSAAFPAALRSQLERGLPFAAARAAAAETLCPGAADLLQTPNNILGIEYCKAILRQGGGRPGAAPPPPAATVPPTEPREVLPRLQEQYEKNPDLAGWLTIPGTRIDYPVMYSPDEPERYLHANFDIDYSFAGLPFLDAACDTESGNRIIYAHNMLDGSMFRTLLKYQQKDFWQRNPVISFNTLYEEQEYEIVAAFYDKVYKKSDTNFKFYQFYDTSDQSSFDEAMAYYREHALYDTGVTAQCGDLFLTLVTCAYQTENGRFVVVARKK